MINIFEEAFKANAALNSEKLNESHISKKSMTKADVDSYESKFRKLLADSDNLTTGYFGENSTEISDSGFKLYSQVASLEVEFEPKTGKYSVYIKDDECPEYNEARHGRGFNELIDELEDLTNAGLTYFYCLSNPFDYYKIDEPLEEGILDGVTGAISKVGKAVSGAITSAANALNEDEELVDEIDEGLLDGAKDAVSKVGNVVKSTVAGALSGAASALQEDEEPVEEGLFNKKKKPEQKSTSATQARKWQVYDCWDKIVVGEYDTKPEAEDSATSRGHDGRYRVQMSESKSINEDALDDSGVATACISTLSERMPNSKFYIDSTRFILGKDLPDYFDTDEIIKYSQFTDENNVRATNNYKIIDRTRTDESKSIKESIALNKIRFTENVDSFQPEDELMVVYNSDLDDEMTEEEIQAEAESLIGCDICKCGICGANYVCKEDEVADSQDLIVIDEVDVENAEMEETSDKESADTEEFDVHESLLFRHLTEAEGDSEVSEAEEVIKEPTEDVKNTITPETAEEPEKVCPVCGATENQVVTATIAPIKDNLEDEEATIEKSAEEVEEVSEVTDEEEIVEEGIGGAIAGGLLGGAALGVPGAIGGAMVGSFAQDKLNEDIDSDNIFVTGAELVVLEPVFYSNVEDLGWEQSDVRHFEKLGYIKDGKLTFPRGTKFIVVADETPSGNGVMLKLVKTGDEFEFVYEDENDERFLLVDTIKDEEVEEEKSAVSLSETSLDINESKLNKLFTKFARENYDNVVNVRINSGSLVNGQLCLEGYVRTKSGRKRPIKLVSEGLVVSDDVTRIKIIEKGPFTESAVVKSNRVPFVLECKISGNRVDFTGLKYNYTIKENTELFSVSGKVFLD